MGRSRRRNRRGSPGPLLNGGTITAVTASAETLAPAFVSVPGSAWNAASDRPVLPLEGFSGGDDIPGPPLGFDDPPFSIDALALRDSDDPAQLDLRSASELRSAIEAHELLSAAAGVAVMERPVLILEAEPGGDALALSAEPPAAAAGEAPAELELQTELELAANEAPA